MSSAAVTEVEHEIGLAGRLSLHVRTTNVRIRGVAGSAVRVRGLGDPSLDGVRLAPGSAELSVRVTSGRAGDLEIDVPFGAAVTVQGASSDIEVVGLHGDQRYRSASGDLRLRAVRGSITAEAVSGDVDVVADGLTSILVRTVSGELSVRAGTLTALRATTTSGDVHVAAWFDGPGPFGIESVSGDVTIAPANGIRITASTISGDVRSDLPGRAEGSRAERSLVIGDGGSTVAFRSMSGDLRVVQALPLALVVPPTPADPQSPPRAEPLDDPDAAERLDILRALERGVIDIDEAGRRLEALDGIARYREALHG